MQIIPLQPVPSQIVTALLDGQVTQLRIYQKNYGLYCDISVNNTLIIGGVKCENLNRIKRSEYLAFLGDVFFFDTQGDTDPYYTGLGPFGTARYNFIYVSEAEVLLIAAAHGVAA